MLNANLLQKFQRSLLPPSTG